MAKDCFILPVPTEVQFLIFEFEHKSNYKPVLQELLDKKCKYCDRYFCYAFHLRPEPFQPTGVVNFSRPSQTCVNALNIRLVQAYQRREGQTRIRMPRRYQKR